MGIDIKDGIVSGGPKLEVPAHMSLGKYLLDKLKEYCSTEGSICLINATTGEKQTYRSLLQNIVNFAEGLRQMEVKRGDVIALCSDNRAEFIITVIGILCTGATVTFISTLYTKGEIIHALSISKPKIVIVNEAFISQNLEIFKSSPHVERIIQLNGVPMASDVVAYENMMINTDIWDFEAAEVNGKSDLAFISYSSGTTGLPKGVMLTHLNILYGIIIIGSAKENYEIVKVLTLTSWLHIYGLLTVIECLVRHRTVVYLPEYKPHTFLRTIQEFKINKIITVSSMVIFLAKSDITKLYDLSSVLVVQSGAAPLSVDMIKAAKKCLPRCKGILQGFGMNETAVTVLLQDELFLDDMRDQGSCGSPLPGIEAKVVDVNSRNKLGVNQEGEICVKGPTVMKGYMDNDAATREAIDDEGYLKTGDIGYYNSVGCFFIVDRLKELIKYKGYQVPPVIIEKALLQHVCVADCGVVGAPDELVGELSTAFVLVKVGSNFTEAELLQFANERLSPINRLRGGIIFVNEIPKNIAGKILRKELRNMLSELMENKHDVLNKQN